MSYYRVVFLSPLYMEIISALVISLLIHIPVIFDIVALKFLLRKYSFTLKQIIGIVIATLVAWSFLASLASMGTEFTYFVMPRGFTPTDMSLVKLVALIPFLNLIPAAIEAFIFKKVGSQTGKYTLKQLFPVTLLARVIAAYLWLAGLSILTRL